MNYLNISMLKEPQKKYFYDRKATGWVIIESKTVPDSPIRSAPDALIA